VRFGVSHSHESMAHLNYSAGSTECLQAADNDLYAGVNSPLQALLRRAPLK